MERFELNSETLRAFLQRRGIPHAYNAQLDQLGVPKPGEPEWLLRIAPRPQHQLCVLVLSVPRPVPAGREAAVQRACNLVNVSQAAGCWLFHPGQREVLFRLTLPMADVAYGDEGLERLLKTVLATVEGERAGLLSVFDGAEPDTLAPSA